MRTFCCTVIVGTILYTLAAPGAALAQTPTARQPGKTGAARPDLPRHLSGAGTDDLVYLNNPIDKAAVQAREDRESASNQAVTEGEALFKAGHAQAAIVSYQTALSLAPTEGFTYQRLAEAYASIGQFEEASQAYHKVLVEGFGPGIGSGVGGSADIWAKYALVLAKTNKPLEAVQTYNHGAFMLDYEDSQHNGGKPYLKVLLPEIVMENALPNQVQYTPERLQALADTLLAHEERSFGSIKEDTAHMQEAVKLYPDSPVTQYYLGEALLGPVHAVAAKAAYQKAIELGDDQTIAAAKERLTMLH